MRTTVDLPDDLFRQAKARAALEGLSFKELLTHCVEQTLQHEATLSSREAQTTQLDLAQLDTDLLAVADEAGSLMSRSTTQQISHWARIGRELEMTPEISIERVSQVLRGQDSYDGLKAEEQALVRAVWKDRMKTLAASLRLDEEFCAEGRPYVELDESGAVVRRDP